MSDRAISLADQFTQANDEFIATVEPLSQEQWLTMSDGEQRTVAALTSHVANGHAYLIATFMAMANGEVPPAGSSADLDAHNAENGERDAAVNKEETIDLLKQNGADAAAQVRTLSDDQLARTGKLLSDRSTMPVEQWIEFVLIAHPRNHLASIREALGQTA